MDEHIPKSNVTLAFWLAGTMPDGIMQIAEREKNISGLTQHKILNSAVSYKVFTCLVSITSRYFILFEVIVKGVVYRRATDFFFQGFSFPSHLVESVYQL